MTETKKTSKKPITQGLVYKISNDFNEKIYIGSTTRRLSTRMANHRNDALRNNKSGKLWAEMREFGGKGFKISLLERIPIDQKEYPDCLIELRRLENDYISYARADGLELYNTRPAWQNPDLVKEKQRKLYEKHRLDDDWVIKNRERVKKYYQEHKEQAKMYQAQYQKKHAKIIKEDPEKCQKLKEERKKYYQEHILERKEKYEKHKSEILEKRKIWYLEHAEELKRTYSETHKPTKRTNRGITSDEQKTKLKAYYQKNKERLLEKGRQYREKKKLESEKIEKKNEKNEEN